MTFLQRLFHPTPTQSSRHLSQIGKTQRRNRYKAFHDELAAKVGKQIPWSSK